MTQQNGSLCIPLEKKKKDEVNDKEQMDMTVQNKQTKNNLDASKKDCKKNKTERSNLTPQAEHDINPLPPFRLRILPSLL